MTETSTAATTNRPEDYRLGSVGRPLPGVEVRIADDGEILLRGANIFQGYHRNEDASREAIENGWLHTGDVGRLDEDGYLYITGRKKDIIVLSNGKKVTPSELEGLLLGDACFDQVMIHGAARNFFSALIVPNLTQVQKLREESTVWPT